MSLAENITRRLLSDLSQESADPNIALNDSLRLLSKWRSILIQNTLVKREGTKVLSGPLKGLDFVDQSAEGCHVAKLLGCYEQPLQPYIKRALSKNYTTVINIGCAEGYYAVGFARAIPKVTSLAFDSDPNAQESCRNLAEKTKCLTAYM